MPGTDSIKFLRFVIYKSIRNGLKMLDFAQSVQNDRWRKKYLKPSKRKIEKNFPPKCKKVPKAYENLSISVNVYRQ